VGPGLPEACPSDPLPDSAQSPPERLTKGLSSRDKGLGEDDLWVPSANSLHPTPRPCCQPCRRS
jgi:hypothetical protein